MTGEQENELIAYLAELGFNAEKLRADIADAARKDPAVFSVRDSLMFGLDKVKFDLRLERDHQFKTYRLTQYKTTIQYTVDIDHHLINGIDTALLEQRMKVVDWEKFFKPGDHFTPAESKEIQKMVSDLWQLTADNSMVGADIQSQIQFKYWPEEKWDDAAKEFARDYQRNRDFHTGPYSICNANLAFYHTSGLVDDVHEALSVLKLEVYPGIDVYTCLEETLSKNPDHFELKCSRNEPEGYIEYTIPVTKIEGWFSLDTYTAVFTPYPAIEHGIYNGIDSRQLEDMMRKIDWHRDTELFIFHKDREPDFQPRVAEVQEQIYRLSQDIVGADIADKLQLKYWADATFFSDMLLQQAWDYLEELPKRQHIFGVDIDAQMAFNLLCGRAVLKIDPLKMFHAESDNWIRLDLNNKEASGNYQMKIINGYSLKQLEQSLDSFPIHNYDHDLLRNHIVQGDIAPVKLKDERKVFLEANPEKATLNVYSDNMRPIQANINLDPDWQPELQKEPTVKQEKQNNNTNKFHLKKPFTRRKGKGL